MRALTAAAITMLFLAAPNQDANAIDMAPPPEGVAPFVVELRELFAPFHIVPIIVPRGEQVGDFFDRQANTLLASADDCFPKLKVRTQQGQLPSVLTVSSRGLAAALGASGIFEAGGGAAQKRSYALSFRDVEVRTASVVQLRNALPTKAAQECDLIRPFLQALGSAKPVSAGSVYGLKAPLRRVATIKADNKPPQIPIVIGTVLFYARRVLRVDVVENLSGEANLGQQLLQALGLESAFKVSAKTDAGNFHSVEFVGNTVIPVAYAPAFDIPKVDIAEQGKTTLQLVEVNPEEIRTNVALMEQLNGRRWATTIYRSPFAGDEPPKFVLGAPPPRHEWEAQVPEGRI